MPKSFIVLGSKNRKIKLENTTHPCPRCKRSDTVQLTRHEHEFILFNRRIALPNSMNVRYECNKCKWKDQNLPENDPFNQVMLACDDDIDYFSSVNYLFVGSKPLSHQLTSSTTASSDFLNNKRHYSISFDLPSSTTNRSFWKRKRDLLFKRASYS